ncbi:hypothetical protein MMC26_003734 [Xylographa opegraphella]|nr:hypothetical protein [Xylographa opegraphella]
MPLSSLFTPNKPIRSGAKAGPPLSDRVAEMPTEKVQQKYLSAKRKATESAGARYAGLAANAATKIPVLGPFLPLESVVKSGEDHAFRGLRIRERERVLESDLARRRETAPRYEGRGEAFRNGIGKACSGAPARRV